MLEAAKYRAEAAKCRDLAATLADRRMASSLRTIADEYDGMARQLEQGAGEQDAAPGVE